MPRMCKGCGQRRLLQTAAAATSATSSAPTRTPTTPLPPHHYKPCAPAAPPIMGLPSATTARANSHFTPDHALQNNERIALVDPRLATNLADKSAHTLRAIHTPGHAANHVCLLLEEDGLLFSGDHILNGSTTIIDPPDGHMGDYLDSLDLLHTLCMEHGAQHILPAHGHPLPDALQAISHLKAHRLRREAKIAAIMQAHPEGNLATWLPLAYDDVDPSLHPIARRSMLAHVERIQGMNL